MQILNDCANVDRIMYIPVMAAATALLLSFLWFRARGRMVTRVGVPMHQLLSPVAASAESTPECFKARHVLTGTFSANLYCEYAILSADAIGTGSMGACKG
jgi:hypothetical protein